MRRGLQVTEKMEREMGLEPTTSSLGISVSIENKGQGVHCGECRSWSFSNLQPLLHQQPLNGGLLEGSRTLHYSHEQTAPSLTIWAKPTFL